ncbi:MAG: hypothetical protein KZQ70_00565, partial [gamma proteobacterium symbiont of Lucinoma myriamae]|nr:hypothetical protein [gamma proteobacterium symbiont of Lucinoma myriamae]
SLNNSLTNSLTSTTCQDAIIRSDKLSSKFSAKQNKHYPTVFYHYLGENSLLQLFIPVKQIHPWFLNDLTQSQVVFSL